MRVKFWKIALLAFGVLMLSACRGQVSVQRSSDGSLNVSVTLNETDVNTAITAALNASPNPLLREPHVDLQPGQIVVTGQHDRANGVGRVSGTFTIVPAVTSGNLGLTITSMSIEGVSSSDAVVTDLNQRIQAALADRINRDHPNVTLNSVTVTDTDMVIELNLHR